MHQDISEKKTTVQKLWGNSRGGALLYVLGIAMAILIIILGLFTQSKLFIDRRSARSARVLRDNRLSSEIKYILSKPNCGIVDLDAGNLTSSSSLSLTATYPVQQGLRSDLLGPSNDILKVGSKYLKFKINNIDVGPFDPRLYQNMHGPTSLEGLDLKTSSVMNRQYIPTGSMDDYLASLNVEVSLDDASTKANKVPLLSSFAVIVKMQGGQIKGCRSVSSVAKVEEICDKLGGSWDSSAFTCTTNQKRTGSGVLETCSYNNICNADPQFVIK